MNIVMLLSAICTGIATFCCAMLFINFVKSLDIENSSDDEEKNAKSKNHVYDPA